MPFFLFVFFFLFIQNIVFGQKNLNSFPKSNQLEKMIMDNFTVANGFPTGTLSQIYQAPDGYIWMTSYEGIIRFDGFKCEIFNTENTPIFTENSFFEIKGDNSGRIYFNSTTEIFMYENGHFEKLLELKEKQINPITLTIDEKERLWISGLPEGVFYLENGTKQFVNIDSDQTKTSFFMISNQKGKMYLTDSKYIFEYKNQKFEKIKDDSDFSQKNILAIKADQQGNLWIGTNAGLYYFDGKQIKKEISSPNIETFYIFPTKKNIWLAIGEKIYAKEDGIFKEVKHQLFKSIRYFIFEDREENIWIQTHRRGLIRFKKSKVKFFKSKNIINTISAKGNKVLRGGEGGIFEYLEKEQWKTFPLKTDMSQGRIRSIRQEKDGKIWLSAYGSLIRIEEKKETVLYGEKYFRLSFRDSKNQLWLSVYPADLALLENDSLKTIHTFKASVMAIREDRNGFLWVATAGQGVFVLKNNQIVKHYDDKNGLTNHTVFNIHVDSENVLWLACNGGLTRIEGEKVNNFSSKNGLASDQVYDIIEDNKGIFWMPFAKGLATLNKKMLNDFANGKIDKIQTKVYDQYEGVITDGFTPVSYSCKDFDGKMWFPATDGVFMVDPKQLSVDSTFLPVHLERFIADQDTFYMQKNIKIEAGKKNYHFQFTAIHFYAPEKVRFKYFLEGFDNQWTENNYQQREAIYTNLPAGNYVFRLMACNSDGIWNETGVSLPFEIKAFWYETWWAKIFAVLFLLSLAVWFYKIRMKQMKNRQILLVQMVKERTAEIFEQKQEIERQAVHLQELNQIKDKMFSVISHDLRSPLAQLESVLLLFESQVLSEQEFKEWLPIINKNIRNTSNLTNNLLFWAKSQIKGLESKKEIFDVYELVENKINLFEKDILQKGVIIHNYLEKGTKIKADKNLIALVLRNLIGNAIKFCKKDEKIDIKAEITQVQIRLSVEDTGMGISAENLPRIFGNQNFSTKGTLQEEGTGLGLSFCKELIEKAGGEIWVESQMNKGSNFTFILPI